MSKKIIVFALNAMLLALSFPVKRSMRENPPHRLSGAPLASFRVRSHKLAWMGAPLVI
jgi:hypothetical protein